MSAQSTPPEFAKLVDWVDGRLPEAEAAQLARLIEHTDDRTRATLAWLRAFRGARRFAPLAAPSASARAGALRAFAQRANAAAEPGLLRRIIATLAPAPKFSAARSAHARADLRRLSFNADGFDVIVEIQARREDGLFDVNGQVLAPENNNEADAADITVQLLRDLAQAGMTATNEFGEFAFEAVAPGDYAIILRAQRVEIEVAPLALSS